MTARLQSTKERSQDLQHRRLQRKIIIEFGIVVLIVPFAVAGTDTTPGFLFSIPLFCWASSTSPPPLLHNSQQIYSLPSLTLQYPNHNFPRLPSIMAIITHIPIQCTPRHQLHLPSPIFSHLAPKSNNVWKSPLAEVSKRPMTFRGIWKHIPDNR
ncbi:hypothetical protein M501DRAFT_217687 [Patellaria atrata CBS 101060]|uniref:Uncharacterized protein n=1 Tax=Patellaria atrata CBS 101060 TaxID=1346257 RepID=A0A9P4VL36_9PEZI|nr:hypothetical protein M501DRAFT_217687 [Patellaria atrata CBS 101060]